MLFALLVWPLVSGPAGAATVLDYVERCAPRVAPRTALAIISVESGGKWWAVNDNDVNATPRFASPEEAIAYTERRVAEGGSIDIGMTQLNSVHLRSLHLTVREAFEPCTNVAMGMSVLQSAWASSQRRFGTTRYALFKAFEAYNGGTGAWASTSPSLRARVERYANEVWTRAAAMPFIGAASAAPATPPRSVAIARTGFDGSDNRRSAHGVQVIFQEGRR